MKDILNMAIGPLTTKVWLGIIGALTVIVGGIVLIVDNADKRKVEVAKEAGAAGTIVAGHETTLGQLKDANNAERNLQAGGERNADRYAQCVQDSRDPSGCDRYKPLAD